MNTEIYGAQWCKDTQRVIKQLEDADVLYTLFKIDNKEHGKEYTQKIMNINRSTFTR